MMKKTNKEKRTKERSFITFLIVMSISFFLIYNLFMFALPRQNSPNNDVRETPSTTNSNSSNDVAKPAVPIENVFTVKGKDYLSEGGVLELPVNGASGYASISLRLREGPSTETNTIATLLAGEGFTILEESGDWWKIETKKEIGWVMHKYCFVNLPDVIPSIVYNNTNSYSSKIVSSGKSIPNITGQKLYNAFAYNERIDKDEYIIPVLYAMAPKISAAQQAALADGNTLIIYEGFRPYAIQRKIVENFEALVNSDPSVKSGVVDSQWSMDWFISTGISNHQRGSAIDVSLGKAIKHESKLSGEYIYKSVIEYAEYSMPSQIHELSVASIVFKSPVSSKSETLWKEAILSDSMNSEAKLLQQYCTNAGLTPLASEWWHFNDLSSVKLSTKIQIDGKYFIQENFSRVPDVDISTLTQ